jgi:hypothetical protein
MTSKTYADLGLHIADHTLDTIYEIAKKRNPGGKERDIIRDTLQGAAIYIMVRDGYITPANENDTADMRVSKMTETEARLDVVNQNGMNVTVIINLVEGPIQGRVEARN